MWIKENFFKYTIAVILVLTIVLLLYLTAPVLAPFLWFFAATLLPLLFATFLYYILRPVVEFLGRWLSRPISILLIYFIIFLVILTLALFVIPSITEKIHETDFSRWDIESVKERINTFIAHFKRIVPVSEIPEAETFIFNGIQKFNAFIYQLFVDLIRTLTSIAIALALTPFVLFFFLRDDRLMPNFILRYTPNEFQEEVKNVLKDVDSTLSEFIIAQMMVAGTVGALLLIGFILIGIPQAIGLTLFAMIFYIIPIIGTIIAILPALFIAFTISYFMVFKVLMVMFVAHFIESNLVTPHFMSQRLKIHPLTIILLLLAAGTLYGLLGLLLVTPTYAIVKVLIWNFYKISHVRYVLAKRNKEELKESQLPE